MVKLSHEEGNVLAVYSDGARSLSSLLRSSSLFGGSSSGNQANEKLRSGSDRYYPCICGQQREAVRREKNQIELVRQWWSTTQISHTHIL